jgi:GDP-4-dehydro-6-deoxy-D-mannose reductase
MKYLITGITGFAGPHLTNILIKDGHEVYGLVRGTNGMETDILDIVNAADYNKIKFLYSDLKNFRTLNKIFKEYTFDGVFHLAAQSHPPSSFVDPIGTFETNVMGSVNLIQCILDNQPKCKLMFCSSVEVYGNEGIDQRNIKEDNVILPANPYGATKASIDIYLQERMANKQINAFITRAFCHSGPRRGKTFSISSDAYQIALMMKNQQERVLKIGNLETTRVVMDVRDIVMGYYLLMKHPESSGQVFNISGDTPRKMRYYTDKLKEYSGLTDIKEEIYKPFWREIDIDYQMGNDEKFRNLTGYKNQYDIDITMKDLLEYWIKKIE